MSSPEELTAADAVDQLGVAVVEVGNAFAAFVPAITRAGSSLRDLFVAIADAAEDLAERAPEK